MTLASYDNLTKLAVSSRNDVFRATLDGEPCILKAYDLTSESGPTARRRVRREVLR
eukprot:COSAG01_NODE_4064_length_5387_cov_3.329236_2_plen_56_part_00